MNDCFWPWQWTARREICGRLVDGTRPYCVRSGKRSGSDSRLHRSISERIQCVYSTQKGYSSHLLSLHEPSSQPSKAIDASPPALLDYGAVFNFDFSRDGSTLVCACERKTIAVFDPHNKRHIKAKTDAHNDCVNGIRFIDRHTFCSCSDDRTVRIWDLRNMQQPRNVLAGHEHWVKNVEYIDGNLVSSGFDGKILLWTDVMSIPSGETPTPQLLFSAKNLMRTAINPVTRTLAMSTNSGYIMVVHDLDLDFLASDLRGFRPHDYQLMQMTRTPIRNAHTFSHLFDKSRLRNRVELVADFYDSNDAELISSLKVHPQGWCLLSRNTSVERKNEFTSVHDIRCEPAASTRADDELHGGSVTASDPGADDVDPSEALYTVSISIEQRLPRQMPRSHLTPSSSSSSLAPFSSGPSSAAAAPASGPSAAAPGAAAKRRKRPHDQSFTGSSGDHSVGGAAAEAPPPFFPAYMPMSGDDQDTAAAREERRRRVISQVLPSAQERISTVRRPGGRAAASTDTVLVVVTSNGDGYDRTFVIIDDAEGADGGGANAFAQAGASIRENEMRLAYYIEEPNMMHGFIKEPCFSADGRFVCSPFAHGFRLLSFDDACNEPFACGTSVPHTTASYRPPVELRELTSCYSHQNVVVSSAMSPVEPLVVTGCLGGQVCFYQPVL